MGSTKTLLLIDGHALAFRAYYAFAKSREGGLRTSMGIPTSVTYGFLRALMDVLGQEQPQALGVAFDLGVPTFRHEADVNYKANRAETPEDFLIDVQNLQRVLELLAIPIITVPGYEADDVLGTLACVGKSQGYRVKILTGDRDLFQLVQRDRSITVLYMSTQYGKGWRGSKIEDYGTEDVIAKLGISPAQVVDYKALCGDASDNIPGVKGVGPKTAVSLLNTYGDLDKIYACLGDLKPALRNRLMDGQAAAYHSQRLAQIVQDVPLDLPLAQLHPQGFEAAPVFALLQQLELREFAQKLPQWQQILGGTVSQASVETIVPPSTTETPNLSQDNPNHGDEDTSFWSAEETAAFRASQISQDDLPESTSPIQPQIIQTLDDLVALVERLKTYGDPQAPVAWDTETTGLDPLDASLVGIGCAWGAGPQEMAYLPLGHKQGQNLPLQETLAYLRPILESDRYPKVLQNAKYDRRVFKHQGIHLQGVVMDTLLASYILFPEGSHSLESLAAHYLQIHTPSYTDLVKKGQTLADLGIDRVAQYCGMDVHLTYRLREALGADLQNEPDLLQLLHRVELPLEPILAAMEDRGIRVDRPYLQQFSKTLAEELQSLETQAQIAAGQPFNLASPKQLSELLFTTLGLDVKKSRKLKSGYSTDAAVLEKLRGDHPVVDLLLDHRTLAKLKSTYGDSLVNLVRSDTGRIHTHWNQAVTATGRLSSSNPNLQNIPIRTSFSRQIRQAFVPEPGWEMVSADYSQIELRILAHLSQEPLLLHAYQTGKDVHRLTAQVLLEKDEVSPEERRLGKVINFGVIYGMGAQRFARETGVSVADAKAFLQRFHDRYAQVFDYLQRMERQALAQGFVTTLLGRKRQFQFTSAKLRKLRGQDPQTIDLDSLKGMGPNDAALLRAAANAPIQGSSADIIKLAMLEVNRLIQNYQARLLLQVHDELVLEMPPQEWPLLEETLPKVMETVVDLSIPLVVDIHRGQNWMDAH